ncbi:hypothetical protein AQJ67_21310 [Streptomyces caeruleatus]|uniref:Uncharacterized protein n=1 Tax=Streptomyces caeruleatus TaxID=661399 RepID=A0A101U1R3_9ACTN|nr:hypothetical protein AQJ67_21310 [Streptomyces caeruleatus]
MPTMVRALASWIAAMPKSVRTTRPRPRVRVTSVSTRTLPGLMSRWRTPRACTWRSAATRPMPIRAVSHGPSGPSSAMMRSRERPATNSMTIHRRSPSSTTS